MEVLCSIIAGPAQHVQQYAGHVQQDAGFLQQFYKHHGKQGMRLRATGLWITL